MAPPPAAAAEEVESRHKFVTLQNLSRFYSDARPLFGDTFGEVRVPRHHLFDRLNAAAHDSAIKIV